MDWIDVAEWTSMCAAYSEIEIPAFTQVLANASARFGSQERGSD